MTLSEKIAKEQVQNTSVFLYREGLFWKAYEYSAFLFVQHIRAYRAQKKHVKILKQDVVSLGFPDCALDDVLKDRESERIDEKCIEIKADFPIIKEEEFEQWKVVTESRTQQTKKLEEVAISDHSVLSRLRTFRVESASPLQCMLFISELQKELYT